MLWTSLTAGRGVAEEAGCAPRGTVAPFEDSPPNTHGASDICPSFRFSATSQQPALALRLRSRKAEDPLGSAVVLFAFPSSCRGGLFGNRTQGGCAKGHSPVICATAPSLPAGDGCTAIVLCIFFQFSFTTKMAERASNAHGDVTLRKSPHWTNTYNKWDTWQVIACMPHRFLLAETTRGRPRREDVHPSAGVLSAITLLL